MTRSRNLKARVLLIGGTGQLGAELLPLVQRDMECIAPQRESFDLTKVEAVRAFVRDVRPDVIVNAAGYTDVDRAESEPKACYEMNEQAPALLAEECRRLHALLIHYSTDYVFSGEHRVPYKEADETGPVNVYGTSKLAGESAVRATGASYCIVRTSWLYSLRRRNFLLTILRLARERPELRVVDDQVGSPTTAAYVAQATTRVIQEWLHLDREAEAKAVYHVAALGQTTWCEFAREILRLDPHREEHLAREVVAVPTTAYPTSASRPAYSVLDSTHFCERFRVSGVPWKDQLRGQMLQLGPGGTTTRDQP